MPFKAPHDKLIAERYNDPWWIIHEPLVFECHYGTFTVPAGTVTDFCSYPGKSGEPAGALHDYLYQTGIVSKDIADRIFYIALREDGMSVTKATLMYQAVKWGGWRAWNNYRSKDK